MNILSRFNRKTTSSASTPPPSNSSSSLQQNNGSGSAATQDTNASQQKKHKLPTAQQLKNEFYSLQKYESFLWDQLQFSNRVHLRYSNILCAEWSRIHACVEPSVMQEAEPYRVEALKQFSDFVKEGSIDGKQSHLVPKSVIPRFENEADLEVVHANLIRAKDLNAFMPKYEVKTDFIVGHAPVEEEMASFINCIVHHKVPLVAVLAKTVEKGRKKAFQWWPDRRHRIIHDAEEKCQIELLSEQKHPTFCEKRLRATMDNVTHNFIMIHYENWPDFGIPAADDFLSMADFINSVLDRSENRTLYVHCSAGVGRTSTLVSSLIMYEQAKHHFTKDEQVATLASSQSSQEATSDDTRNQDSAATFSIYLPLIIQILKFHRPGMTQTASQYQFSFDFIRSRIEKQYPNVALKHEPILQSGESV